MGGCYKQVLLCTKLQTGQSFLTKVHRSKGRAVFIVYGYRFGEVKHQGKIRYFLIDPKNTIKEQYTVFYKFIFMPSNSYIEVSDNTLTYKSIDNGSNTKINSSGVLKEYWCEYEEIGGDNSNGNPIVKFNPAIGQFSVI